MKASCIISLLFICVSVDLFAQPNAVETTYDLSYFLPEGNYQYDSNIPEPATVLGFQLGRQHADWGQVVEYMKALAEASDRVTLREVGRTYQHRPFIEAVITSPENQRNIEKIREEHLALTDVDRSTDLDIRKMPVVVNLVYSIHGNEPSGVNASLAVAYFLAAAQSNEIDDLLRNTVIVLYPGANPDGINRFANWVNTTRSQTDVSDLNSREFQEPWPSSRTNHYWADCNRDWPMAQHPEGITGVNTYFKWMPNVLADQHEQGADRPYYFSPGHPKRTHQLTPRQNQELTAEVSAYCAKELDKIGTLYYSKEGYDDYYYGKGAAYGDIHGSVCLLYEQGTSRGHLRETRNGVRSFAWTIRNQAFGSYGTILAGYRLKDKLLAYQRDYYKNVKADIAKQPVKGYVFDTRGSRSVGYHFIENMGHHRINVYHLAKDFSVDGKTFKADEAFIIPVDQKNNTMIRAIMEDCLSYEDSTFYDISTWSFPYAFNLEFAQVKNTNGFIGKQVVEYRFVPGQMIGGKSDYGYLFTNVEFYTPKVMYELLRKGIHVQASNRPFHFRSGDIEKEMGYGTILVSAWNQPVSSDELYELLSKLAKESGVDIYAATTGLMQDVDLGSPAYTALKLPKVAILVGRTMGVPDSGEAWFLLDRRFQMRPTLIEATATLTSRKLSRYNVIILANGIPDLTKESEKALKDWVANGGTLIASGKAYSWVDKSGILPISVKDASFKEDSTRYRAYSEKKEAAAGNSISGVILSCSLDSSHPLAWGLEQPEIAVLKKGNLIFEKDSDPYVSPLHYTEKPLLSGFLSEKNESLLRNTPAVFAKKYKSGAVFVFADDLNFRSYYFGTSKLFMNAVFFGECL